VDINRVISDAADPDSGRDWIAGDAPIYGDHNVAALPAGPQLAPQHGFSDCCPRSGGKPCGALWDEI